LISDEVQQSVASAAVQGVCKGSQDLQLICGQGK